MHDHLLQLCRALLPGAAGVILATPNGRILAHEPGRVPDARTARALAREAVRLRGAGPATSQLVPRAEGAYLVFFAPAPGAASSGALPLPA